MMGFFDKVKKALGSKKEDIESQNSVNNEVIDESTFIESIENDNGNFNDDEEIKSEYLEETLIHDETLDEPLPDKIRNFKYLDDLINSGAREIVLDSDIILDDDEKSRYMNGIKFDADALVIDGNGHFIDARKMTRIFHVFSELTLRNVRLKNGAGIDGGAIYLRKNGVLKVIDSEFSDNVANENGAAIFNEGIIDLHKTNFTNNSTLEGDGGAIYNKKGSSLSGFDCEFNGNTSSNHGGAIYSAGKAKIEQFRFLNNVTQEGDVVFSPIEESLEIIDCRFKNNVDKSEKIKERQAIFENSLSFHYLRDMIRRGVLKIVLDSDIVLFDDEISYFANGISIDADNVVIDGNNHSIDARGRTRIFQIAGNNIVLKNIKLKNGHSNIGGGAIHNLGSLNLDNCILEGNSSKKGHGGAIYNEKGVLKITKSKLKLNSVKKGYGGAIRNNADLTVEESSLSNNRAKYYGGAIYNDGGHVDVVQSKLSNNVAKEGGAIYNYGGASRFNRCCLSSNRSNDYGGAIYNRLGKMNIKYSTLLNNSSNNLGGAITNFEYINVVDCEFIKNNAPKDIINNKGYLQLNNGFFTRNKSEYIILSENDEGKEDVSLNVSYGQFKGNVVGESLIYNNGKYCNVNDAVFENDLSESKYQNIDNKSDLTLANIKINNSIKNIFNEGSITIKKSKTDFEKNIWGSGSIKNEVIPLKDTNNFTYLDRMIHSSDTKEITLDRNIRLSAHELDFYEGGIELDIDGLVIDGNGKTISGGFKTRAFYITANNVTLKNIVFRNGYSYKNYENPLNSSGGALRIHKCSNLILINCKFINCESEVDGGAISNSGNIKIEKIHLKDNKAKEDGGSIVNSGIMQIDNCEAQENEAMHGGAIYNGGNLNIVNSNLVYNLALEGGVVYNDESANLDIVSSTFKHNEALLIVDSSFGHCGAIYNAGGNLILDDCTILDNKSGTIFNVSGGKCTITGSVFSDNHSNFGGAISNEKSEIYILDSTFTGNSSTLEGGAIYNEKGRLHITNSTLTKNRSESYGGAIFDSNNLGRVLVERCTFEDNISGLDGGAIYPSTKKKIDCTFRNNIPND